MVARRVSHLSAEASHGHYLAGFFSWIALLVGVFNLNCLVA
ncbi:hypothetical protein MGWOODY_Tha1624 [hydrothermal vent metagenome]|uniref:Uncharacterized protein n=1 Tax=hydrothermal vent metagenome TaxID=652676 RepID=A0A170PM33_9ZZZZ